VQPAKIETKEAPVAHGEHTEEPYVYKPERQRLGQALDTGVANVEAGAESESVPGPQTVQTRSAVVVHGAE
jgi:hypothetical protein